MFHVRAKPGIGLAGRKPQGASLAMRQTLFAMLLLFSPSLVIAQETGPAAADRAAIRDVIARQIQAFQHDDATAAFGFASPSIQQMMGTADNFLDLVRNHYQPVYHPRSTAFRDLTEEDGQVVQRVDVVGPDGLGAQALYSMEKQPDGTWRISGCELTIPAAVGT